MITIWKCECGQENSITNRYCISCSKEISDKWVDLIFLEDFWGTTESLRRERNEKRKYRAEKRHLLFRRMYKPRLLGIMIATMVFLLIITGIFEGKVSLEETLCNICVVEVDCVKDVVVIALGTGAMVKRKIVTTVEDTSGISEQLFDKVSNIQSVAKPVFKTNTSTIGGLSQSQEKKMTCLENMGETIANRSVEVVNQFMHSIHSLCMRKGWEGRE